MKKIQINKENSEHKSAKKTVEWYIFNAEHKAAPRQNLPTVQIWGHKVKTWLKIWKSGGILSESNILEI